MSTVVNRAEQLLQRTQNTWVGEPTHYFYYYYYYYYGHRQRPRTTDPHPRSGHTGDDELRG